MTSTGGPNTRSRSRQGSVPDSRPPSRAPSRAEQESSLQGDADNEQSQTQQLPLLSEQRVQEVRNICFEEGQGLCGRLDSLQAQVEERLRLTDGTDGQLEAIRQEVDTLRSVVEATNVNPNDDLLNDIRTLRVDVNALMERRSNVGSVAGRSGAGEPIILPSQMAAAVQAADNKQSADMRPAASHSGTRHRVSRSYRHIPSSGVRRRDDDDSSSSNEDVDREDRLDTTDEENEPRLLSFFERPKGPKHAGLASLKRADPRFDRLMSYRFYRLSRPESRRDSRTTGMVGQLIKRMGLNIDEHKFDGSDPIMVFDFLSRFVEEADTLAMSEAQAYLCLPYFLTHTASSAFRAAKAGSQTGGVKVWPEAVQFLLRTYATNGAIRQALAAFRSVRQAPNESEMEYSAKLTNAAYRCGSIHSDVEKMTHFIDGLSPTIRTIVARFREDTPRWEVTYERLVQFARDEGDAYRARHPSALATSAPRSRRINTNQVTFVERSDDRTLEQDDADEEIDLIDDGSVPTADLPSTSTEETVNVLQTTVPPPHIAGSRIPGRVGWVSRPSQAVICHCCYAEGHIAPKCDVPLRDIDTIVSNFNALSEDDKKRVPHTTYNHAMAFITLRDKNVSDDTTKNATPEAKN